MVQWGVIVTLAIFLAGVIYRTGYLSAQVHDLLEWRKNMRIDMHEISDKMECVSSGMKALTTLIEERTERRFHSRESE